METPLQQQFLHFIHSVFPSLSADSLGYNSLALFAIALCACVLYGVARLFLRPKLITWIAKTDNSWDDALHEHGFFRRLLHLLPAVFIYLFTPALVTQTNVLHNALIKGAQLYMLVSGLLAAYAVLSTLEDIYNTSSRAKRAPITGFVQVIKLVLTILVTILCISLLVDKSPLLVVSGFTAIAAVLLLIFRDTILGFVAGIQIAANRMFNTGDWIELPKFNVDGEVQQIGLTTVKVRNWDNTVSTLPTYSLTTEAIKNWQGMQESGGRRIKRAIFIDIHSVALCDDDMLEAFSSIRALSAYIKQKNTDLDNYHRTENIDKTDKGNGRHLTNIGTFRAYLEHYLRQHEHINQSLTVMVRQLPPNEFGIPLELYCFSKVKNWVAYEHIQADIFDHVMAMLPLFQLRAYQRDGYPMPHSQNQTEQ